MVAAMLAIVVVLVGEASADTQAAPASAGSTVAYRLVELPGDTKGFRPTVVLALGPSGTMAGSGVVRGDDRPRAFRVRRDRLERFVPPFPSDQSRAHGINGRGTTVGWTSVADEPPTGFVWGPDGHIARLGRDTMVLAINARGTIVGIVGGRRAARWESGSDTPRPLPMDDEGDAPRWSWAAAINDHDVVVGCIGTGVPRDAPRPVVWHGTTAPRKLPLPEGASEGCATAVHDGREPMVVGVVTIEGRERAVAWTPAGAVTVLPLAPGGTESSASAVDARGRIVGTLDRAQAVLWPVRDGPPLILAHAVVADGGLASAPPPLAVALAIDVRGRIALQRLDADGPTAVLLVPLEEGRPGESPR